MANIKFEGEKARNYEQKCLCVLVLDTSGSMNEIIDNTNAVSTGQTQIIDGKKYNIVSGGISRLDKLTEGMQSFYQDIEADYRTSQKLEIAVITFNDDASLIQSPSLIEDCPPLMLNAHGMTNLTDSMEMAMDLVESRKSWYRTTNQPFYRPWIILLTDGEPNEGEDIASLANAIRQEVNDKHFEFLPIGVDNADMETLRKLSANIPALPLAGAKFSNFFKWLSASMSAIIDKKPGETVNLTEGAEDWISKLGKYEI